MDSKGALSVTAGAAVATRGDPGRRVAGRDPGAGLLVGHASCCASPSASPNSALAAGVPQAEALAELARTQRMLQWESGTFLVLLLTLSGALFWYYWRDMQRARGTQAFFAALTHELRTPLTSVRLQTEAIAAGEPTQELIDRLLADTHRLESQIDKTLELARIEGGGSLAEQAIRLDPLAGARAARHRRARKARRRCSSVTVEPALPPVRGDTAALQLILRNLRGEFAAPRRSRAAAGQRDGAQAATASSCAIRDDGRGFEGDPSRLGRLFQRGGASRGTGVGLYLVRVLMERMGGGVEFAHAPGRRIRGDAALPAQRWLSRAA